MTKLEKLKDQVQAKYQEINLSLDWKAIETLSNEEFYGLIGQMNAYKEVLDLIQKLQ